MTPPAHRESIQARILPGQKLRLIAPAGKHTKTEKKELQKELDFAACEAIAHRARSGIARTMEPDIRTDAEAAQAMIEIIDDEMQRTSELTLAVMNSTGEEEDEKRAEGPGGREKGSSSCTTPAGNCTNAFAGTCRKARRTRPPAGSCPRSSSPRSTGQRSSASKRR